MKPAALQDVSPKRPPLSDIKTLRERARQHFGKGAVRSGWGLALLAAGALLGASAAVAAAGGSLADAQRAYQADRAACIHGDTGQDRSTCLREAEAALQEAKRGRLDDGQAQFEQNRLLRCEKQPPEDRQDCIRRMNGEGTTSGSVKGGGIYRELVVPVPAPGSK